MNNQPIGVLDSGVGGLSIWKEIVRQHPKESTIYIADSKNCPYGKKTSRQIHNLSRRLIEFLLKKKVKLIVLACNTITVSSLEKLRKEFPKIPIIGTVPVIKTAVEKTQNKRIGVFSTTRTAKSRYQKELIEKFANGLSVINLGSDKIVPLIEKGVEGQKLKKALVQALDKFKKENIDTLALGCSHFPFVKKQIVKILGSNVEILDSSGAIGRQVGRVLNIRNELSSQDKPTHIFYTTGEKNKFQHAIKRLVGYNATKAEEISL